MKEDFGGRKIIRERCVPEDFISIGMEVPERIQDYSLCQCLNCGKILPTLKVNMEKQIFKRCRFCIATNEFKIVNDKISQITVSTCNHEYYTYIVDTNLFDIIKQYKWRVSKKCNKKYLVSGLPKKHTALYLHQLVYGKPVPDGYVLDHINCNEFDNRAKNIRCITATENAQNVSVKCTNKLGVRGTWYSSKYNNYGSTITVDGKAYYLKYKKTLEEAILNRYCAEQYFGLHIAERNPKAMDIVNQFSEEKRERINKEVQDTIHKREQFYASKKE